MQMRKGTALAVIFLLFIGLADGSAQSFFPSRIKGTLQIKFTSNAPGVQVAIDGIPAGTIPLTVFVLPGAHRFSFTAPGEETKTITYPVRGDTEVPFVVTAKTYPLTVNTNVAGASLAIDGAPFAGNSTSISAGSHTLTVAAAGYQTLTVPFSQPNGPNTLNVTMVSGTYPLTVNTNAPGASLAIDGVVFAGNATSVTAGNHTLTVNAAGYQTLTIPFNQPSGPNTLNVTLMASAFPLKVTTNVAGATLAVDGIPFAGGATSIAAGAHTLTVSAAGYQTLTIPFNQPSGPNTLNVTLMASTFPLTVNTNVANASLSIDGQSFAGNTLSVTPGAHTLTVNAPGYQTMTMPFNQPSGPNTINITLMAVPGTLQLNTAKLPNTGSPYRFFINGGEVRTGSQTLSPGTYAVRVVSGESFVLETTITVASGQNLTLTPSVQWEIR